MILSAAFRVASRCPNVKIQMTGQPFRCLKTSNVIQDSERQFIRRAKERLGIRDRAMAPQQGTAFNIGKGAVAGGAIFGLGALAYYGAGMSAEPGNLERSMMWPQYVKERIQTTYGYFGGSLAFTAASAMAAFRSQGLMNLMMRHPMVTMFGSLAALIGTQMVVSSIQYSPGFGPKQLAWMVHSGLVGVVLAPMCFMGGPLLVRAAWMTAGVVGGLSTIAYCAPSEKFLNMGGPLAIGLGVVFASSIGSAFLPPTTALGSGLYSIAIYGGLLLFSGFLLYDTQKVVRNAEQHPENAIVPFDPIAASMGIYLDTINIFIRIAQILAMGGGRKK